MTHRDLQPRMPLKRYMSVPKLLDLLHGNRLHFSAMSALQDKLEGRLSSLEDFFESGVHEALGNLVNNVAPVALGRELNPPEAIEEARRRSNEYEIARDAKVYRTAFGIIPASKVKSAQDLASCQKNWMYVSCWDDSLGESVAMWKVYGGAEASVCVHTSLVKLMKALEAPPGWKLDVMPMRYSGWEHPETSDHPYNFFNRKHAAYAYESEVRLLTYDPSADPLTDNPNSGTSLSFQAADAIEGITVSPEAGAWFVDLMQEIATERFGLDVKVEPSALDITMRS